MSTGAEAPIELALGTVQFGLAYGVVGSGQRVADDDARHILGSAAAAGLRVLDTAVAYGDIEQRLAGLAGDHGFSVVTKIPPLPSALDNAGAAAFVRDTLARSQQRLGDLLHTVLFHRADDLLGPLGPAAWAQAIAWTAGSNRRLGVSCYGPEQLQAVRERFPVAVAQLPGNAFDQRLRALDATGVELHLRSAFLQGLLLAPAAVGSQRLPAAAAALQRWEQRCAEAGLSPLVAALGVVKSLPGLRCCVVGVESLAQWQQIAAAWAQAAPLDWPELATDDPAVIDPRLWRTA